MKFSNKKLFDDWKANNNNRMGDAIFQTVEIWACRMEQEMKSGKKVADIYDETFKSSDIYEMSGYMYECAVSVLINTWIHGPELEIAIKQAKEKRRQGKIEKTSDH